MMNQKLIGFFGLISLVFITGILLIVTFYNLHDSTLHPNDVIIKLKKIFIHIMNFVL